MRRTDLLTAALLVLAGVGAIGWLIPRYVADTGASSALPPAFMPYVAAGLLTAAALGWLLSTLWQHDQSDTPLTLGSLRFLLASLAVLCGACVLMNVAGYIAGGTALVAGMLLVARARPVTILVTAVAAPAALWALFVQLLGTPLP
jgi:hypothetical protein